MNYKTIRSNLNTSLVINKSEFISHLRRCTSVDEANKIINEIRKEHSEANHNCYAYIIGESKSQKRCSDDGEPSQTAGMPILNVLEHNDVTDVICVVTRYFGGVKLGAGGLVRAYSKSCSTALEQATFVSKEKGYLVEVITDYKFGPKIDHFLKEEQITVVDKQFFEKITYSIALDQDKYTQCNEFLTNISSDEIIVEIIDEIYIDKVA